MTWTRALLSTGVLLVVATGAGELHAAPSETGGTVGGTVGATGEAPSEAPADTTSEAPVASPAASEPPADVGAPAAPAPAPASEGPASAGASATLTPAGLKTKSSTRKRKRQAPAGVILTEKGKVKDTRKWIHRYSPERHLFELGVFGGIFIASDDHDLYDPATRPVRPHTPGPPLYKTVPDIGVRLAYFPLRFLGVEGEFAAIPNKVREIPDPSAFVFSGRGHAILQLPYRVAPFVLGGYGALGVRSGPDALGNDIDGAGHFGGGLKIYISRMAAFRVEGRGIVSAQAQKRSPEFTAHAEVLAGFSLVLGRVRPLPPEKDLDPDKDGFLDPNDKCPKLAGVAPDGCPAIDSDNDSFLDPVDKCPYEPGVAPDGCPPPDKDKDGFLDPDDKCPEEPGIAPDGCPPPPDSDGDGIIDKIDDCPLVAETYNGYKDQDGCPDVIPEKVVWKEGRAIEGIFFEFNKDKIQKKSTKTLDAAVEILKEFEDIRIEISGHTDDVGTDEANLDLSRRRAEAVKKYMVEKGVDPSRIETVGYGRSKPIDTGKSSKSRAKNRRIEFRVIVVDKTGTATVMQNPANDAAAVEAAADKGATTPDGPGAPDAKPAEKPADKATEKPAPKPAPK